MFHVFLFCVFLQLPANYALNETPTLPTVPTGDYPNIYCDHFPQPSDVDEGNYGDAVCYIDGTYADDLLLMEILVTDDGQTFLQEAYDFPGIKVTRVSLLNFGRFHGATKAIDILNGDDGNGTVEIFVEIFSGKAVRMVLEIYGFYL
ncbi:hypothetical protein Zmor_009718 [Zophobas morio]|uniref:Uncharacterized protein n=1 Tax=Zophobas morio TaxID=2755281 RepID=A0AA38IHC8_9CUCU|nr:hypothetical protein Zmor_009718 [Zophobas morio]